MTAQLPLSDCYDVVVELMWVWMGNRLNSLDCGMADMRSLCCVQARKDWLPILHNFSSKERQTLYNLSRPSSGADLKKDVTRNDLVANVQDQLRPALSCAGNQYLATRIAGDTLKVNTDAMLSLHFEYMLG